MLDGRARMCGSSFRRRARIASLARPSLYDPTASGASRVQSLAKAVTVRKAARKQRSLYTDGPRVAWNGLNDITDKICLARRDLAVTARPGDCGTIACIARLSIAILMTTRSTSVAAFFWRRLPRSALRRCKAGAQRAAPTRRAARSLRRRRPDPRRRRQSWDAQPIDDQHVWPQVADDQPSRTSCSR